MCGIRTQQRTSWARPTNPLGTPTHLTRMSSDRISGSEKPVEVVGVAVDLEGAANTQVWEALGDEFMQGNQGETVELSSLRGEGKVIGLYFSAHWSASRPWPSSQHPFRHRTHAPTARPQLAGAHRARRLRRFWSRHTRSCRQRARSSRSSSSPVTRT